jgi:hypothetical protein
MTSGLSTGVTTYCAPAPMAASAVFSSSTLPTPTSAWWPKTRVTSAMTCSAFGVVMVTSMPETPPAMSARLASMSCSELSARMIATTPGVSSPSMIWSLVIKRMGSGWIQIMITQIPLTAARARSRRRPARPRLRRGARD